MQIPNPNSKPKVSDILKSSVKAYGIGFGWGFLIGIAWLLWVYRRAEIFPGDPELQRYYAWLRRLDASD
jgi:apolipoprotein N-acyltransferase